MSGKSRGKELTKKKIMDRYGLTPALIGRCLPAPRKMRNPYYRSAAPMLLWREADVIKAIETNPEIRAYLDKKDAKRQRAIRRIKAADEFLRRFSPEMLFDEGCSLDRRFILHIGPTNSGKTYNALQALKHAESGAYLGPLRLLALEVYENLNQDGVPCSLLTGEEFVEVPGASFTASTIELCDLQERYDVVVIDEAQMLADPTRGPHWLRAIALVDAREVHICLAPEAESIITRIIEQLEAPCEIHRHDRLVPLEYKGLFRDITKVEPGDALIAFSRKRVLQLAAVLEKSDIRASVIYGALPPASRREEVRRFSEKETTVVAATDAIGMGISLPIKRVIFVETEKFDGKSRRPLTRTEIRQIAGRAGRFGKYDLGEVLTMNNGRLISRALLEPIRDVKRLTLGFPEEALTYDYPLMDLLTQWNRLPGNDLFIREDMEDAIKLLGKLGKYPRSTDRKLIYSLITCPIDTDNNDLVGYWYECCQCILYGGVIPRPPFEETDLESCELKYHAYDIYHQLLRRIGIEDDCLEEKQQLSDKINDFLKEEKSAFLRRCRRCGRELSIHDRYSICDKCYDREHYRVDF